MEKNESTELLKEIVKLLVIFLKRDVNQNNIIKDLSDVRFQPKRIAELVGTTPNTVSVALHNFKKGKKKNDKKPTK